MSTAEATDQNPARVAVITGAGSGIGAAAAEILAQDGLAIGLVGRGLRDLSRVSKTLAKKGSPTLVLPADVSDDSMIKRAFDSVMAQWGRLDVVIANAGINGVWAPLEDLTSEEWDETFRVNVRGTFLTLHHAIPHLRVRGGSIVIVASVNGTRTFGNLGASAYAVSKAAQVALARMAARELAIHRIRVNAICPGSIATDIGSSMKRRNLESLGRFGAHGIPLSSDQPGSPRQVAELIRFLASELSAHITGTEVYIDGAESLFGS